MNVNQMLNYYEVKNQYQIKFSELENEMIECFRIMDNTRLKEVNNEYKALFEKYKKFTEEAFSDEN